MTTTYIALLRAINVGGQNSVRMADLRACLDRLGFAGVQTLLQSGNVVFRGPSRAPTSLESTLEHEFARRLDLATAVFVRTAAEWRAHIRGNPYPTEAKTNPGHLLLLPLKRAPTAGQVAALRAAVVGRERVSAKGRALYAVYPDGAGISRLTIALIERHLDTRTTGRNWNTVGKIAALSAAQA